MYPKFHSFPWQMESKYRIWFWFDTLWIFNAECVCGPGHKAGNEIKCNESNTAYEIIIFFFWQSLRHSKSTYAWIRPFRIRPEPDHSDNIYAFVKKLWAHFKSAHDANRHRGLEVKPSSYTFYIFPFFPLFIFIFTKTNHVDRRVCYTDILSYGLTLE